MATDSLAHRVDAVNRQAEALTKEQRKRLISLTEASKELGVVPRTVRRYVASGLLTGYKVGPRLIRVDRDDVLGLLRQIPTA